MIVAKKSLGQNFLVDKNVVNKIINTIEITNGNIIEIGPGLGALTKKILEKNPKKLIIIEKDFELYQKLLNKFDNISWNDAIINLHRPENIGKYKSNFYERLAYDEILASFLVHSEVRKKIKKIKKQKKIFKSHFNIQRNNKKK